jgi:hypothetical protein
MNDNNTLLDLPIGTKIKYTALDGKERVMTYKGCTHMVKAIKGEDYTPALSFEYNGATMSVPLSVWDFTGVKWEVVENT